MTEATIRKRLKQLGKPARAVVNARYCKTGAGEYAEGDKFIGLDTPTLRALSREYELVPMRELGAMLKSPWHEERLLALLIMVRRYQRGDQHERDAIHALYVRNTKYVNNWDLVDSSAEHIVGKHLPPGRRALLTKLARSPLLWERRIAMLSTFAYIKQDDFGDALRIATILLDDDHDLIHKAVGWMLREIGQRDRAVEERFLRAHAHRMPRTALRYALERFPPALRQKYMVQSKAQP